MSWPEISWLDGLTSHQQEQLAKAFRARVGVFTGAPGTGKTYTLARIIKAIIAKHGERAIRIAAPTGKASVRAVQTLNAAGVKIPVTTIHRLLGVTGIQDGKFEFTHNAGNRLTAEYYVIDECSMLGNSLGAALFSAIPGNSHVLLIGDHHQLPPVERGAVLRDCLAAGVPHGDLTAIHRNTGRIVKACKTIREGGRYEPSVKPLYGTDENLAHLETHSNAETIERLIGAYESIRKSSTIKLDLKWDVQVMCYMNKGSQASRTELNQTLQGIVNPHGERVLMPFRLGDKIICLKNHMYSWKVDGKEEGAFVANGQMGELMHVDDGRVWIHLETETRGLRAPICISKLALQEGWDLGYAITTHKSQGSSWPLTIIVVDHSGSARFMGSRQLIYTAISRAERYCLTIGKRSVIDQDCLTDSINKRITRLGHLLHERIHNEYGVPIWAG